MVREEIKVFGFPVRGRIQRVGYRRRLLSIAGHLRNIQDGRVKLF
ncbi:MAG: hypothetical protein ABDH32_07245 [Candidatus Caldarchaeales archaeon]